MLLVGGNPGAPGSDVWALSLTGVATWAQLLPAGVPPSGRNASAAVYDSVRDRILVFGGYDGTARNDLWSLDLSGTPAWTQIAAAGTPPSPRWGHVAIYDPVRDRMLVHGGTAAFGGPGIDDLWELSLAGTPTWTQLTPRATRAAVTPIPRSTTPCAIACWCLGATTAPFPSTAMNGLTSGP